MDTVISPARDYETDRAAWSGQSWKDYGDQRHMTAMYDLVVMVTYIEKVFDGPGGNTWAMNMRHPRHGYIWYGTKSYRSLEAAKEAAFDFFVWADKWVKRMDAGEDCSVAKKKWANTLGLVRG